jgi:protein-S-isoprenylcysteine O-methyltransferase Ste14
MGVAKRGALRSGMLWRAALAFAALPGVVAFALPVLLASVTGDPARFHLDGLAVILPGAALLLRCVRDFYVAGRGTLAPWSPPHELVIVGLYRYSRNPMYVSVGVILLGWALAFRSQALLLYGLAVLIAFHLRVVAGEEPWLERKHGEEWRRYRSRVRRWL